MSLKEQSAVHFKTESQKGTASPSWNSFAKCLMQILYVVYKMQNFSWCCHTDKFRAIILNFVHWIIPIMQFEVFSVSVSVRALTMLIAHENVPGMRLTSLPTISWLGNIMFLRGGGEGSGARQSQHPLYVVIRLPTKSSMRIFSVFHKPTCGTLPCAGSGHFSNHSTCHICHKCKQHRRCEPVFSNEHSTCLPISYLNVSSQVSFGPGIMGCFSTLFAHPHLKQELEHN